MITAAGCQLQQFIEVEKGSLKVHFFKVKSVIGGNAVILKKMDWRHHRV